MDHNYVIQKVPGRKNDAAYWLCKLQQQEEGELFEPLVRRAKFVDEEAAKECKAFLDHVKAHGPAARPAQR